MTTSPFLLLDGAVAAEGADHGVAAHYGSPNIEQRRLLAGEAIVDLSHRGVLSISGVDRLSWLNSLASQAVDRLRAGDSVETLLLDASGRIEHDIRAFEDGTEIWLIVEDAQKQALYDWLFKMRFMLRVELHDRSEELAVVATMAEDPAALGVAAAAPNGVPLVWIDPWASVTPGGVQYAHAEGHGAEGWRWNESLVPREALAALSERCGASATPAVAGLLAAEALRIAAWRPRLATEGDEKTLPHELDWLRTAVHLTKGCYRGQETVAKVHNLGHPPRRLVMLDLDGSETVLPPHGAPVFAERVRPESEAEWREVGTVTSSAIHFELGPIALAVIKRAVPTNVPLRVDHDDTQVAAAQIPIVPTDAGAAANVPRLPRLGARITR